MTHDSSDSAAAESKLRDDFEVWDKIVTLVDRCAEKAKDDPDSVTDVIDSEFARLRRAQKDALAHDGFAELVRSRLRQVTLAAERAASAGASSTPDPEPESMTIGPVYGPTAPFEFNGRLVPVGHTDPWFHGPRLPFGWHGRAAECWPYEPVGGAAAGCPCRGCSKVRERAEARRDSEERMKVAMAAAREEYKAALFMEWTDDLLASTFALNDGRLVTWGEATIADHEERIAMFERNAHANLEGAARHALAITRLRESDAAKLAELVAA